MLRRMVTKRDTIVTLREKIVSQRRISFLSAMLLKYIGPLRACQGMLLSMAQMGIRYRRRDLILILKGRLYKNVITQVKEGRAMRIAFRGNQARTLMILRNALTMNRIIATRILRLSIRTRFTRRNRVNARLSTYVLIPNNSVNTNNFCEMRRKMTMLSRRALCKIDIITNPRLNRMTRNFVISASTATKTGRRNRIKVFNLSTIRCLMRSTCVFRMGITLLFLRGKEMDINRETITIPLRVNSTQMINRRSIRRARCRVLCFKVTRIRRRLITRMMFIAIKRVGRPVLILFMRFALKISRFQFGPSARLSIILNDLVRWFTCAIKRFINDCLPITRTLNITITQVLITRPAIIGRRRIRARLNNVTRRATGFFFIRIRVNNFPIIRRNRTIFISILRLMITDPIIRVTTNLSTSTITMNGRRIQNTRRFANKRHVFERMEVSAYSSTRAVIIIRLGYGTRITNPSRNSRGRFAFNFHKFTIR